MPNGVYDKAREAFLDAAIDWDTNNIKAVAVNVSGAGTLYTVDLAAHDNLDDIPAAARLATSANLTGKTKTAGVARCSDFGLTFGASVATVEAIVFYVDTGTESTSKLIAYIDTATGLPFTPPPGGGTVNFVVDPGANGVFKL